MFEGRFCESPDGGSRALEEGVMVSAGESPAIAESEGSFELEGVSDGGSSSFFVEAAELSGRIPGLEGSITGDWDGIAFSGFSVFAGAATGSLGIDAGLAALEDDLAGSGIVVGSAGVGTGVRVGNTRGIDASTAAGVNTIGGSKRAKVVNASQSLNSPVHAAAHFGSRENKLKGGTISGSHGGPMVVITVPLAAVLFPKPQVGHARSLRSSCFIPASIGSGRLLGSYQISPTVKLSYS